MATYKVLTGIDYPPNKRAEAGDAVSDIPSQSIKWLLDQGIIEVIVSDSKTNKKPSKASQSEDDE